MIHQINGLEKVIKDMVSDNLIDPISDPDFGCEVGFFGLFWSQDFI